MANLEKWTKAARETENNSVLVAVPAQSGEDASHNWSFFVADLLGPFSIPLLLGIGAYSGVYRHRNRKNRMGNRGRNDRVVILFYQDRVDLHRRPQFGTKVGEFVESYRLEDLQRPDSMTISLAGMTWLHSKLPTAKLEKALAAHGILFKPGGTLA